MNKKTTYLLLIFLFFAGTVFIIFRHKSKADKDEITFYPLKERTGPLALTQDWANTRKLVSNLYSSVAENPKDTKSSLSLATIFIQEARVTGNYSYYDMAAMKQVNNVLAADSNNFEALTLKALIYLSQHHFGDGLAIAIKAQKLNPYNAFIYGLLVDANVEMGKYNDAINAADKMVSIRPDLSSYSRISYLREIHGDYSGAIGAMKLAVQAGVPGDDGTEWARIQLGHLYENNNDSKNAEFQYAQSLEYRKGYAPAIAGLAHLAFINKDYQRAITYYEQADTLIRDYSIKENLAEAYKLTEQLKKSDSLSRFVIEEMNKDAASASANETAGHYVDRELANAYLVINNNDKALDHALAEYNRRPENIDVNETVAWVYYKMNEPQKALPYIKVALKTGSKNPVLLCHAGLIYAKANEKQLAKTTLTEVLKNAPNIEEELRSESVNMLNTL